MDIRITDESGDFEERRDTARFLALLELTNDSIKQATQFMQVVTKGGPMTAPDDNGTTKTIQGFIQRADRLQAQLEQRMKETPHEQ
jgi:hypothetical protein